nr:MAG TPA: hypothetical protein [Caudoviricetes sp.]
MPINSLTSLQYFCLIITIIKGFRPIIAILLFYYSLFMTRVQSLYP